MWYIWCGPYSPVFGKSKMATFEGYFLAEKELKKEIKNAYYRHYNEEETVNKILQEFGLDIQHSHIVNGHVPVEAKNGDSPIKCGGKLLVIDGGFSRAYQDKTGIAGYTLVDNSHGMWIVAHEPFTSKEEAVANETDIVSDSILVETYPDRRHVSDTDIGKEIKESIYYLELLLDAFRKGIISDKGVN